MALGEEMRALERDLAMRVSIKVRSSWPPSRNCRRGASGSPRAAADSFRTRSLRSHAMKTARVSHLQRQASVGPARTGGGA